MMSSRCAGCLHNAHTTLKRVHKQRTSLWQFPSPLHLTTTHPSTAQLLLSAGALLHLHNHKPGTGWLRGLPTRSNPLHAAASRGHAYVCKMIVEVCDPWHDTAGLPILLPGLETRNCANCVLHPSHVT
jgi:hypothetical protein